MSPGKKQTVTEVTAAVILRDGRVLIARRRKGDRQGGKWEFPGGKRLPGESPEEGLRRELYEELGVRCRIGLPFGTWEHTYDYGAIRLLFYLVSDMKGDIRLNTHEEARWVLPGELISYDFSEADRPAALKIAEEMSKPVSG